jgi:hypothetical protein
MTTDNSESQQVETTKIESIDWIKVPQDSIEDLDLLPHQLTDTQLYIIAGMFDEGALTTRSVWKRTLVKMYQMELFEFGIESPKQKNYLDKINEWIFSNQSNGKFVKEYRSFSDMMKQERKRARHEFELFEEIERAFSYTDLGKPAYETILNNLETLESQNLVMRRDGKGVNAKYLWTLNPRFLKMYRKRREQIKDNFESLGQRTLKFYNISEIKNS